MYLETIILVVIRSVIQPLLTYDFEMFSRSMVQKCALSISLVLVMISCSSDNEATPSWKQTGVTFAKNYITEFSELVSKSASVASSKVSSSNCGNFGLIVQKNRVKFYEWLNNTWTDRSSYLGPDSDIDPYLVETEDFTGDGVPEFLVSYNEDGKDGGSEFGAIFMQTSCQWQWAKLRGYDGVTEVMDLLSYDSGTGSLTAFDYGPEGRADVVLNFNPQTNEFETMTLSADDVDIYDSPSGNQQQSKYVVGIECDLRTTGLQSSWSGTQYIWRYYDVWSDGSRTINNSGMGYNPPLDCL